MDRFRGLNEFAQADLRDTTNNGCKLELISGDASFRKYYRLGKYIFVDAPSKTEKNREFVEYSKLLISSGVRAPKVIDCDLENGYLKIEDLGNEQFASIAIGDKQEEYYRKAIEVLVKLSSIDCTELEIYDEKFIDRELNIFVDWYIEKHLGKKLSNKDFEIWKNVEEILVNNDLVQPQIAMHRDYHCRNIMVLSNDLGIIDFQDMVHGPITYDLVSLLKDCYVTLDLNLREKLLEYGYELYKAKNLLADISFTQFEKFFDLAGMQRHLKAIGIFCRLKYRDGKDQYLQYLPRTFGYIRETVAKYPEFSSFKNLLEQEFLR